MSDKTEGAKAAGRPAEENAERRTPNAEPARPRWLAFLPLASVLLLWLCYHPADLGWLAYAALAPWFAFLILETRVRRACGMTWLTWFLFFCLGMNWLRYTSGLGAGVVAAILGLEMFVFAYLARRMLSLRNDALTWTALGVMFIGWEYLRLYLMTGFPWFLLGHTQHAYAPLLQIVDIGGVPLLGLPAAVSSALIGGAFARRAAGRPAGRDVAFAAAGVAALLAAFSAYGVYRLKTLPKVDALRVGIVQGNVPQDIKDMIRFNDKYDPHDSLEDHERLSRQIRQDSDLIVWAETMFPFPMLAKYPENERAMCRMADRLDRPMLLGVIVEDPDGSDFNSAWLVDADGKITGRYDKRHLVMVAEWMPFKKIAPWLYTLMEKITSLKAIGGMTAGEYLPMMQARGKKFGALICFDSMWPDEAREYTRDGADFLVTISNDGWFKETEQLDQILAVTKIRCVENRIGMARCTNTGISAYIGADGHVREFEVNGQVKSVKGATSAMVAGRCDSSLYTAWGEWFGKLCLAFCGAVALAVCLRRPAPAPAPSQEPKP